MLNPILKMLNPSNGNIQLIGSLLSGGDPRALYNFMLQSNPQFRQFVQANSGKSPDQIARENGVDLGAVLRMLK